MKNCSGVLCHLIVGGLLAAPAISNVATVQAQGREVSLWRGREGSGQTIADAQSVQRATLGFTEAGETQDPIWNVMGGPDGKGSLLFKGGQIVVVPHAQAYGLLQQKFTLEAWIKQDQVAAGTIVRKSGHFALDIAPAASPDGAPLRFVVWLKNKPRAPIVVSAPANNLSLGKWHHVTGVFNAEAQIAKLFVDGIEVGRALIDSPKAGSSLPLGIGAQVDDVKSKAASKYFKGEICDVRWSDGALLPAEFGTVRVPSASLPKP